MYFIFKKFFNFNVALAANIQLEKVNEQLSNELTKQNEQGIRLTQQNAILNTEIDHLSSEQSQHFDGHQQLKEKLTAYIFELNQV